MIEEFTGWTNIPENKKILYDILDKQFPKLKEDERNE